METGLKHSEAYEGIRLWHALKLAKVSNGSVSPEFGLALIDLADYAERQGLRKESEVLTEHYRNVLCRLIRVRWDLIFPHRSA